jgi:alkylation response protein AidB-like acyl-CoA dehydrogenase
MDVTLNEDQEHFKKTFQDFLEAECPSTLLRDLEESEEGYSKELWDKMAELGWMGLGLPEEYGGVVDDFAVLMLLYEEIGRTLMPSPHFTTVALCGRTIAKCGSEDQKKDLIEKIAAGQMTMSLALLEESCTYNPADIKTEARAEGDDYILNGRKLFVPYANTADCLLVAARTADGGAEGDGITLLMVDPGESGVGISPLQIISNEKVFEVVLENVKVPKANVVGAEGGGWSPLAQTLDEAKVLLCAEMVGGSQKAVDMAVEYAKERVQFGRPIGSFQANSFRLADFQTEVDGGRLLTYEAGWKISEGLPALKEIAMAKGYMSDLYKKVAHGCLQVHGGYGFMEEFDIQLYFRKAKACEALLGGADEHREIVAQQMDL